MGYTEQPTVASKRAPRRGGLCPCQEVLEMPFDLMREKTRARSDRSLTILQCGIQPVPRGLVLLKKRTLEV
jgi:hypothetical protein